MKQGLKVSVENAFMYKQYELTTSMEEEDMLIQESGEAANRVDVMLAETERTNQISEAVGDAAIVMDKEEPVTEREAELVQVIGQTAVAGSDASADDVVPSVEELIGKNATLSVEGFEATAKRITQGILAVMKKIWTMIKQFHQSFIGQSARLKRSANLMKERWKAATETNVDPTIPLESNRSVYQIDGKVVNNAKDLITAFDLVREVVGFSTQYIPTNIQLIGNKLKSVMAQTEMAVSSTSLDKDMAKNVIDKAIDEAITSIAPVIETIGKRVSSVFPGTTTHPDNLIGFNEISTGQLLDNVNLVGMIPMSNNGVVELDRLRNAGFVINTSLKDYPVASAKPFNTPSLLEIRQLLYITEKIIDILDDSTEINRLSVLADMIGKSSELVTTKIESRFGISNYRDLQGFRSLMSFNTALARWSSEPAIEAKRYAARVTTAILRVVDLSLKAHQV